jgi:hypothetical protein
MFASYNELNKLLMSYSRAYRVESSFKSKLIMLTSLVELTRCFNELEQLEPILLGSAQIVALRMSGNVLHFWVTKKSLANTTNGWTRQTGRLRPAHLQCVWHKVDKAVDSLFVSMIR